MTRQQLPEFLENHFGTISRGWTKDFDGSRLGATVAQFDHPDGGVCTFATLGLSRHLLDVSGDSPYARLEYCIVVLPTQAETGISSVLINLGKQFLRWHRGIPVGALFDFGRPIVDGSRLTALLAVRPPWGPEDQWSWEFGSEVGTLIWLVPLTEREVRYRAAHGSPAIEAALLESKPSDIYDLMRTSEIV